LAKKCYGQKEKTVFKDAVHSLQKSELFYPKTKINGGKIRAEKILQALPQAHPAQRRQKVGDSLLFC